MKFIGYTNKYSCYLCGSTKDVMYWQGEKINGVNESSVALCEKCYERVKKQKKTNERKQKYIIY